MKNVIATFIQTFLSVILFMLSTLFLFYFNHGVPIATIFFPLIHLDFLFIFSCYLFLSLFLADKYSPRRKFASGLMVFFLWLVISGYWFFQIYYSLVLKIYSDEFNPIGSDHYTFWNKGLYFNLLSLFLLICSGLIFSYVWKNLLDWKSKSVHKSN